jgi:hypothetical protein
MPDHACARSCQKHEIDQAPPPSSPFDSLGYMSPHITGGSKFERSKDAIQMSFHQESYSRLKAILPSPRGTRCRFIQTRSRSLSMALIFTPQPRCPLGEVYSPELGCGGFPGSEDLQRTLSRRVSSHARPAPMIAAHMPPPSPIVRSGSSSIGGGQTLQSKLRPMPGQTGPA